MRKDLPIKDIRIDGGTQRRPVDDETIKRYMALIKDGYKGFPPIDVVSDGESNWLWDGWHRYHAYRKLGKDCISASVEPGTKREAIYFSFHANFDNGLPRQKGVIAEILNMYWDDDEWSTLHNREIANWIGIDESTVRYYKKKRQEEAAKKGAGIPAAQAASEPEKKGSDPTEAAGEQKPAPVLVDSVGEVIPEHLRPLFERAGELKVHIRYLQEMLRSIKQAVDEGDKLYTFCRMQQLETEIGNVKSVLKFSLPYAVCRYCMGSDSENCRICNGGGWVNKMAYDVTSKELKPQ